MVCSPPITVSNGVPFVPKKRRVRTTKSLNIMVHVGSMGFARASLLSGVKKDSTNNVVESRGRQDEHTTLVGDPVSTGRWKDSPNAQLTKKKAALLRPHIFIFKSYWPCSGDKIHFTGSGSIDRASVRRETNAALPWLSARST